MKISIRIFILIMLTILCLFMVSCNNLENKSVTKNDISYQEDKNEVNNNITLKPESGTNKASDQNSDNITDKITPDLGTPSAVPTQPDDYQITPTGSISNNADLFDLDDFKNKVINIVNDDLWYLGDGSYFTVFEEQTMDMEIYTSKETPEIFTIFSTSSGDKEQCYGVLFYSNKQGILNETDTFFSVSSHQKAESMLGKSYTFYKKTEITFGKVTKPVYPQITATKEEEVNKIMKQITETMLWYEFDQGSYKVFIGNFRVNSSWTYAVLENANGKTWIMVIGFYDDGQIEVDDYFDTEENMTEDRVPMIKENAVKVEDVTI